MLIWEIAGFKAGGDKKNSYPFKNWDVGNFPLHISRWVKLTQFYLKVLSSEMDQAKSGLILKVFIKERGAEIFSKFRPPPSCDSSLFFDWQFGNQLGWQR